MARSQLGARASAVRETIAGLCENPASAAELIEEVADRVRSVVPYDTGAWMTTDPDTLLPSAILPMDSNPALHRQFSEVELQGHADINSFDELRRSGRTAAGLSLTTGGDLARSLRYREVHMPHGLRDELRLLARSANATWAIACVTRAQDLPDFTADEVRWVASIADDLGEGLRSRLARPVSGSDAGRSPGMLVVGADGTIEASTGAADAWMESLSAPYPGALPTPIAMVALQAQANAAGSQAGRAARLRLQLPGGGWLLVHADVLRDAGAAAGRVAVVLEPADRAELVPLLVALHGLTGRERDVTELLVGGIGTDEIATRLHISRHTVRDHVKAIFAKVGVSSRVELTAALAQEPLAA